MVGGQQIEENGKASILGSYSDLFQMKELEAEFNSFFVDGLTL